MGVAGVLDRLAQVEPAVLLAVDGYRYGERVVDRREENQAVRAGLPSLVRAVWLGYLDPESPPPSGWIGWERFVSGSGPTEFEPVEFDGGHEWSDVVVAAAAAFLSPANARPPVR